MADPVTVEGTGKIVENLKDAEASLKNVEASFEKIFSLTMSSADKTGQYSIDVKKAKAEFEKLR